MPRLLLPTIVILFLFLASDAYGQICGSATNDPPGCIMTDKRYTGNIVGYNTSPTTSTILDFPCANNHDAWLQFTPLCDTVSFKMLQFNCTPRIPNYGLGVVVIDENLRALNNCFSFKVAGYGNQKLEVGGLEPGRRYHLMFYALFTGQRCTYIIEGYGINTFGVANSGIHGIFEIGVESQTNYWVNKRANGSSYNWTADPGLNIISGVNSYSIMVDAPTAGSYNLCCEITLPDATVQNLCETVTVSPNEDIIFYEKELFCYKGCHDFYGDCLNVEGLYQETTTDGQGRTVQHYLDLCEDPEPRVGIYGQPLISVPAEAAPTVISGYLKVGTRNDYTYGWLDDRGNPIPGANMPQLTVANSRELCFYAIDNLTGCEDTTCAEIRISQPLPDPCTPTNPAGDDLPGCAICTPFYEGSTNGYSSGPVPAGFCGTIENNQFVAVQASGPTITVNITSWDCSNGQGVQLYIVDSNFDPVSTCFSSGGNNVPGVVTANGLIPGEVYFIMIDGFAGDICDFRIDVVGGINQGPPDEVFDIIPDNENPCPGEVVTYSVGDIRNATRYIWRVSANGQILVGQGTNTVQVQWSGTGSNEICILPTNPCIPGIEYCEPVDVVFSSAVFNYPTQIYCAYEFPLLESEYCVGGVNCPGLIPEPGTFCITVGQSVSGTCDSTVCYTFEEIPVSTTVIDTFVCVGACFDFFGDQICDAGFYEKRFANPGQQCEDVYQLNLDVIDLEAIIIEPEPYDCILGDTMWLLGYNSTTGPQISYEWTSLDGGIVERDGNSIGIIRGSGRFVLTVRYGDLGGSFCVKSDTVEVLSNFPPPVVTCTNTGSTVTFSWNPIPGAIHYVIDQDNVPLGITTDTFHRVTNLFPEQPVIFGIRAVGLNGCVSPATIITCQAAPCPPINVAIDSLPPFCMGTNDQPVQLTYQVNGGVGGGTISWFGIGTSPAGVFDPQQGTIGDNNPVFFTYSENDCNYTDTRSFSVYEQPTATFDAESPICLTDDATITYTGDAPSSATFNWDFAGGNIVNSATGEGPYDISWNTGGNYSLNLQVFENGCPSVQEWQQVQVVTPLSQPVINCIQTTSSVEFTWANVPGATNYQVNLLSGATGTQNGNSYLINGLVPGDEIQIEVVASGNNICGPSSDTLTCRAKDCPPVQVSLNQIAPICLYSTATDINLTSILNLTGNTNAAIIEWEIDRTPAPTGIFSPLQLGAGQHEITVKIEDDGCPFTAAIFVDLLPVPEADFIVTSPVCVGETSEINFTSTVLPSSNFTWNFGNGTEQTGNANQGPYELTFQNAGNETISVEVESNGCTSTLATQNIRVTEPIPDFPITCVSTPTTIEFSWPQMMNATDYVVRVISAPATAITNQPDDFTLNVTNLSPLDGVTIEVEIFDNTSTCLPTIVRETCAALDCPPLPPFDVNCNPSTQEMTFTWAPVVGATDYDVTVIDAPAGAITSQPDDFTFIVTNILPLDEVTIRVSVTSTDDVCLVITETLRCQALPCPPLPPFNINCNSTTQELTFTWIPVAGATDYQPTLLNAPPGATTSQPDDFTFIVSNLNPLDEVTIQVQVTSNTDVCLNITEPLTCEAKDCPPIQISKNNIPQQCLDPGENGMPVDLNDFVTVTGDNGNAVVSWFSSSTLSGSVFQPNGSDDRTHIFTISVEEESCTFTEVLTMDVVQIPSSLFTIESPICITDRSRVQLDNTPHPNTTFVWNFGSSTDQLGADPYGPYSLTWSNAMTDQISLYTEKDGCTSETTTLPVRIDPTLIPPVIGCTSDLTSMQFEWAPVAGATNYQVSIDNAPAGFASNQPNDLTLEITNVLPMQSATITVTAINDQSACPPVESTFTCQTPDCPVMTLTFANIPDICLSEDLQPIDLNDYLTITGDLQNGTTTWSGSGANGNGIFDANISGVGTHLMVVEYRELNCETRQTVEVTVHPVPDADAGIDQALSCLDSIANLGGSRNNNNPSAVTYEWTGGNVTNVRNPFSETSEPGTYVLTATNSETGCAKTDSVLITIGNVAPQLLASVDDISCFGYNDGVIRVDSIWGGTEPLLYSLNDNPFLPNSIFQSLGPGDYVIRVQDAIGCEDSIQFSISEPDELTVEMVIIANETPIPFGDSVQLQAISNYAPEFLSSIQWSPADQVPVCDETNIFNCLSIFVTPTGQTVYTVRVEHVNGCAASDNGEVFVSKDKGIYIPSGFSPTNRDGINDIFRIYANLQQVVSIRSFLVFDRWGEVMHEAYDFVPEDDSHGWDGHFRGKKLNPNVFVYMVEVEFFDGSVELFKGDVTLSN